MSLGKGASNHTRVNPTIGMALPRSGESEDRLHDVDQLFGTYIVQVHAQLRGLSRLPVRPFLRDVEVEDHPPQPCVHDAAPRTRNRSGARGRETHYRFGSEPISCYGFCVSPTRTGSRKIAPFESMEPLLSIFPSWRVRGIDLGAGKYPSTVWGKDRKSEEPQGTPQCVFRDSSQPISKPLGIQIFKYRRSTS